MATQINKNRIWTSENQFTRRIKKVTETDKKNALKMIMTQFITALKNKHM